MSSRPWLLWAGIHLSAALLNAFFVYFNWFGWSTPINMVCCLVGTLFVLYNLEQWWRDRGLEKAISSHTWFHCTHPENVDSILKGGLIRGGHLDWAVNLRENYMVCAATRPLHMYGRAIFAVDLSDYTLQSLSKPPWDYRLEVFANKYGKIVGYHQPFGGDTQVALMTVDIPPERLTLIRRG